MGGIGSKIRGSLIKRPIQRFNIESRTDKILEQNKPTPAPRYEVDEQSLSALREKNPDIAESIVKKDDRLLERLKQVYVTSEDPQDFDPDSVKQIENPSRPLPKKENEDISLMSRAALYQQSLFDADDLKPKAGKVTLPQVQAILSKYQSNPTENNIETLAHDYGLKLTHMEELVRHFKLFSIIKGNPDLPDKDDPYEAQPSWVVEGEEEKLPKAISLAGSKRLESGKNSSTDPSISSEK